MPLGFSEISLFCLCKRSLFCLFLKKFPYSRSNSKRNVPILKRHLFLFTHKMDLKKLEQQYNVWFSIFQNNFSFNLPFLDSKTLPLETRILPPGIHTPPPPLPHFSTINGGSHEIDEVKQEKHERSRRTSRASLRQARQRIRNYCGVL